MPGPLHGTRVIELGGIGPGPFTGMFLADLGADVIRVDRHGNAELFPGAPQQDILNRGKRSVILDLKQPEAVEAVLSMVAGADVLIEGFRPGVTERLGLGPADCWERNPKLVYARMTGWGQTGPLAQTAGHDLNYIAITGALGAISEHDGPPQIPLNLVGDFGGGGTYLVIGILAALREAQTSGKGQVVDAAIVDGAAHLLAGTHALLATGPTRERFHHPDRRRRHRQATSRRTGVRRLRAAPTRQHRQRCSTADSHRPRPNSRRPAQRRCVRRCGVLRKPESR